jgi:hypothetical protein
MQITYLEYTNEETEVAKSVLIIILSSLLAGKLWQSYVYRHYIIQSRNWVISTEDLLQYFAQKNYFSETQQTRNIQTCNLHSFQKQSTVA